MLATYYYAVDVICRLNEYKLIGYILYFVITISFHLCILKVQIFKQFARFFLLFFDIFSFMSMEKWNFHKFAKVLTVVFAKW